MSGEVCGKAILKNQEFILVGKYPSLYRRTRSFVNPEVYGRIYHRACFMEKVKEEIVKKGRVEQLGNQATTPKAFLKECMQCGEDISIASEHCPKCGAKQE